ncbi:hypothetical protein IFR05_014640 [Cadophora sp. M221]|nr:hypothetical protein IFR05_014640 [Cadophora sp. M221]
MADTTPKSITMDSRMNDAKLALTGGYSRFIRPSSRLSTSTLVALTSKRPASCSLLQPRKLSTVEFMAKMASGKWVDILVGPEKKEYKLPAEVLVHYSPFFDVAINGPFAESKGGPIMLPEDRTDDFETLIEFIVKGTVQGVLKVEKWGDKTIDRCVGFVIYAKKYNLGPVDDVVYNPPKTALMINGGKGFRGDHIEKIFDSTSDGCSLRTLITQGALSIGGNGFPGPYRKQEKEVHGFGAEFLYQLRLARTSAKWNDPLTKARRQDGAPSFWHEYESDASLPSPVTRRIGS